MTHYDYRAGKKRIDEILDARMPIETSSELPSTDNLTFENAYYSWISALFVDIRNSTELFADGDREQTAKIVRSFTSEIIEILRDDPLRREIGIRGDCVYAIYTTPGKDVSASTQQYGSETRSPRLQSFRVTVTKTGFQELL